MIFCSPQKLNNTHCNNNNKTRGNISKTLTLDNNNTIDDLLADDLQIDSFLDISHENNNDCEDFIKFLNDSSSVNNKMDFLDEIIPKDEINQTSIISFNY